MTKTILISLLLFVSFASASEVETKDKDTHQRTGVDITAMLIGAFGPKILGMDQNLIRANVELSELAKDIKYLKEKSIANRNARIEAELNHYDAAVMRKKLQTTDVERYRKRLKTKTNALRTLGLAAALDFFIFDNTLSDAKLLSETKPSMVSADDPVPTAVKAEQ